MRIHPNGELNSLSERVALRPQFLRQDFVDDRDRGPAGLGRFGHGERAAAKQRQSDRREIIRADAVPQRREGEPLGGSGRPGVLGGAQARALHRLSSPN